MKKRANVLAVMVSLAAIVALSLAAIVALSLALGVTGAGAQGGGKLTLTVNVDEASFVGPALGVQGPFNVEGDTGSGAKSFQCWGWIFEDGLTTNVSQVYNIADRGAIMTQGQEGTLLAVVGGTGDFRNARGEARQTFTGLGFDFTLELTLTGAGP